MSLQEGCSRTVWHVLANLGFLGSRNVNGERKRGGSRFFPSRSRELQFLRIAMFRSAARWLELIDLDSSFREFRPLEETLGQRPSVLPAQGITSWGAMVFDSSLGPTGQQFSGERPARWADKKFFGSPRTAGRCPGLGERLPLWGDYSNGLDCHSRKLLFGSS